MSQHPALLMSHMSDVPASPSMVAASVLAPVVAQLSEQLERMQAEIERLTVERAEMFHRVVQLEAALHRADVLADLRSKFDSESG